jgi:drug/metabolite transporter (DMT)-like permease
MLFAQIASPRGNDIDAPNKPPARAYIPIAVLALVWGCNWPVLKMGVSEIAPLTFRAMTLPLAALGLLLFSKAAGNSIRVPRGWWPKVGVLAALSITGWNALVLFGVQQLPSGRSAILAYTMPIWATLIALAVLREHMSRRKVIGFMLGTTGMFLLLGDEAKNLQHASFGAYLIIGGALMWALGTVLLRKWRPPMVHSALTGWMMLAGSIPLVLVAPLFDDAGMAQFAHLSGRAWFAIAYNIFLAGTLAHFLWYTLARTLPVAVSSMSSLPVPVVGVFAGMILLGERPGATEWVALVLVIVALAAVLVPERRGGETSIGIAIEPD